MNAGLARSVWSEWLKRKRSLTTWLVAGSAAFVPSIILLSRFRHVETLPRVYQQDRFWDTLWVQSWEAMALMILPLAIMLMVSLITQIEYRNNTWKQLHASPQPLVTIFVAKLVVIAVLLGAMVGGFIGAVYLAGVLPAVVFSHVDLPGRAFPLTRFVSRAAVLLVDSLPIVGLQYLLAMRLQSFLTPLGIGMALWILSIGTLSWKYNFLIPYSLAGLDYLKVEYQRPVLLPFSPSVIAMTFFLVFTSVGCALYVSRQDKG